MAENSNTETQQSAAENQQAGSGVETKTKFASAGKPEVVNRVSPSGQQKLPSEKSQNTNQQSGASGEQQQQQAGDAGTGDAAGAGAGAGTSTGEVDKGQVDSVLKQVFGDEYDGDVEKFKGRLAKPVEQQQETDEQKKQKEQALEQRMLDFFIKTDGGDIQRFANLKKIAESDLTQLSEVALKNELSELGFDEKEIEILKKERYYQLTDEEIEAEQNEDQKKLLKKKKEVFGSRPTKKAEQIQKQAKDSLDRLRKAIETQDLVEQEEIKFSSKVDEFFQKLPKKVKLELGKVNDADIDPIEYEYDDADIQAVVAKLKDPKQRKQIIFNEDNTTNLESIAKLVLDNQTLKSALKAVYLESGNREVAKYEKLFPARKAQDLGVRGSGASGGGSSSKFVSAGQPQVVSKNN